MNFVNLPVNRRTCFILALGSLIPGIQAVSSKPPDFMDSFKDSLLMIARNGNGDQIDLSATDSCYNGSVAFLKNVSPFSDNKYCNTNSSSLVSCFLRDGEAVVSLTLDILAGDCQRNPHVQPPNYQESKSLHLEIWIPILASFMLGIFIGLMVFVFWKLRRNFNKTKELNQNDLPSYEKQRALSSSSSKTDITIISETFSKSISPSICHSDSLFSSMKTLGPIPEDESSIPGEIFIDHDFRSDSSNELKIIYSRSLTSLSDFISLDIDLSTNYETSTDATLRRPGETKPPGGVEHNGDSSE